MAKKQQPYEYMRAKIRTGEKAGFKKYTRLLDEGWEVVDKTKISLWGAVDKFAITFRRPNPKYVGPAVVAEEPGIEDAR